MKTYRVVWQIDLDAETALDAAKMARDIQLDPNSIAGGFEIIPSDGRPSSKRAIESLNCLSAYEVNI